MKEVFTSKRAFVPSGAIAQVIKYGDIAFVSGQISINPETGEVEKGTVAEQTERVLTNIKNILEDMGLTMDAVLRTDCFVSSMEVFDEMNEVYQKYFDKDNPPARRTVGAEVWGGLDIEISAVVGLK